MNFTAFLRSGNFSIFVIDSFLKKTVHLQHLKGMQSSKQGV